ncbi:MAG: helix-turn-helix domain-containing protein [Gemmatimonadaceae bacterium]
MRSPHDGARVTLNELRRAAQLLPAGTLVAIPREALLAALEGDGDAKPSREAATPGEADTDRWLKAREAAKRLGVSVRYVYAHRRSFPFAKELPGGAVRFSERGLRRWMDRNW